MSARVHPALAMVFAMVATFVTAHSVAAERPDFGGVWLIEKSQSEAKTIAGKAPPLKPEAAALYAKRKQAKASGIEEEDPLAQCLPHGVPRLLNANQPIHI